MFDVVELFSRHVFDVRSSLIADLQDRRSATCQKWTLL